MQATLERKPMHASNKQKVFMHNSGVARMKKHMDCG